MGKIILNTAIIFVLIIQNIFSQSDNPSIKNTYHKWWLERYVGEPLNSKDSDKMPLVRVKGNRFVIKQDEPVLFRGVSISDPDKIEHQGYWNKRLFEKLKEWGVMLVRIPVHPIAWRERTPAGYLALLDQAVAWCTEVGIYIIIDWHTIGNMKTEQYQDPMYKTSKSETFEFWRTIAWHYTGNNTIAFYELFNEPTLYRGRLGPITWDEWKALMEDLIFMIRSFDNDKIPLVAGFDWAYDLTPLFYEPLKTERIGYVTHPYPSKRNPPYEPKWGIDFGFAANKYPVLATEIGFTANNDSTAKIGFPYGKAIVNYLESNNIGWLSWVFDPEWYPGMIESWDTFKPTANGEFFRQALKGKLP